MMKDINEYNKLSVLIFYTFIDNNLLSIALIFSIS